MKASGGFCHDWLGLVICGLVLVYGGLAAAPSTTAAAACNYELKQNLTLAADSFSFISSENNVNDVNDCVTTCCDDDKCQIALYDVANETCFILRITLQPINWIFRLDVIGIEITRGLTTSMLGSTRSTTNVATSTIPEISTSMIKPSTTSDSNHVTVAGTNEVKSSEQSTNDVTSSDQSPNGDMSLEQSTNPSTSGSPAVTSTGAVSKESTEGSTVNNNLATTQVTNGTLSGFRSLGDITSSLSNTQNGSIMLGNKTGSSESTTNITPITDIATIIVNLATLANITTYNDDPANLTRNDLNNLLAELIKISNSSHLSHKGLALTVSQLNTDDLKTLVAAVENKLKSALIVPSEDSSTVDSATEEAASNATLDRIRPDIDVTVAPNISTSNMTNDQNATSTVDVIKVPRPESDSHQTNGQAAAYDSGRHDQLGTRNAILISTLTVGCTFVIIIFVLIGRWFYIGWPKRHYSKIDQLIDGIYN